MPLEWVPEYYARSGGLAADGFYRLLGRPRLDPLTVLVRETAQNSWDARDSSGDPVEFTIAGRELDPNEIASLRQEVFTDVSQVEPIGQLLGGQHVRGLFISDRGTKGLGGPIHADEVDPENKYDWVDFVLNVGKANTQEYAGGTYGFGKTITYIVSAVNAVVVHSRTHHRGNPETRLIACAIGPEFQHWGKLGTGRHWWGRSVEGAPAPLTGTSADELAARIGMPPFENGEFGTTILVVEPDLGGRTPKQAMTFIAETITWQLWPKMVSVTGDAPPMQMSVTWNGEEVEIPRPVDRPPLHLFERAYRIVSTSEADEGLGERLDLIRCRRPKTDVGLLATVTEVRRPRRHPDDGHEPSDPNSPPRAAAITGAGSHHVALLRAPDLVVDYLEGPPMVAGETEWAGVFRCFDEHDERFAQAEPPTHDAWNPTLMPKGPDKTIVNVALREINRALDDRWSSPPNRGDGSVMNTAVVADELAHLVGSVTGKGPGRAEPRAATKRRPAPLRSEVKYVDSDVAVDEEGALTVMRFDLRHASGARSTRVLVSVGVALDGKESDPSLDPVLGLIDATWGDESVPLSGTEDAFIVESEGPRRIVVRVRRSANSSVLFDVKAEPVV